MSFIPKIFEVSIFGRCLEVSQRSSDSVNTEKERREVFRFDSASVYVCSSCAIALSVLSPSSLNDGSNSARHSLCSSF
jgi:hypothetical protein